MLFYLGLVYASATEAGNAFARLLENPADIFVIGSLIIALVVMLVKFYSAKIKKHEDKIAKHETALEELNKENSGYKLAIADLESKLRQASGEIKQLEKGEYWRNLSDAIHKLNTLNASNDNGIYNKIMENNVVREDYYMPLRALFTQTLEQIEEFIRRNNRR